MQKTTAMLVLATSFGMVIGAVGNRAVSAQKPQISRTEIINADLVECNGKEVRMYTTELAPGVMTPRHRHPGHYLTYVLEGTGVVEEDGRPELKLGPGVSYYIHTSPERPASWHSVWNTSKTQPLISLSFLITEKGQAGTVFDK